VVPGNGGIVVGAARRFKDVLGRAARPGVAAIVTAVAAAGLVPAGAAVAAPNGTETVTVGNRLVDVTFNDPGNTVQWSKAAKLINDAPPGSTIQMGIYNIDDNEVNTAIRAAHNRGVNVFVVANGEHHEDPKGQGKTEVALANLLKSRFRWCDGAAGSSSDACISSTSGGKMHAKYMLFSQTKGAAGVPRSNVVWVSSANFSGSGTSLYNNSVTVYDDPDLYQGMVNNVWLPMWRGTAYAGNDYYDADSFRGYFKSAASNSTVYVSPETQTDLWVERLKFVDAGPDCQLRVMQNMFQNTRIEVAERLRALAVGGCEIKVLTESMEPSVRSQLSHSRIQVSHGPVHDKSILVNARYDGSDARRTIVFTGSHNLSRNALQYNDELILKLADSPDLYNAYLDHFQRAWNDPRTVPDAGDSSSGGSTPPPPPPPVCDNDCWRAQLGTQDYNYIENSNMSDPRLARIIFDRKFYAAAYPDVRPWAEGKVATQGGNFYDHVQWHWLNYGIPWGRAGSATFDPIYYMNNNYDVSLAYGWNNYNGAIGHFISYGRFEGRRGSTFFDPGYYRARYGDIAAWENWAVLDHFTVYGMSEGRQGSAQFAPAFYMGTYADLRAAYGSNGYRQGMSHWLAHGSAEGRQPIP
jgi:phosphatidylserine/phosphatidylglycerophosphate/cardiolipin synthase-like enzyme